MCISPYPINPIAYNWSLFSFYIPHKNIEVFQNKQQTTNHQRGLVSNLLDVGGFRVKNPMGNNFLDLNFVCAIWATPWKSSPCLSFLYYQTWRHKVIFFKGENQWMIELDRNYDKVLWNYKYYYIQISLKERISEWMNWKKNSN